VVAGSAIHGHTLNRRFNRKAPPPPYHKSRRSISKRAPGQSEDKGAAGELKKGWEVESFEETIEMIKSETDNLLLII